MSDLLPSGVQITDPLTGRFAEILTPAALEFVAGLQRRFNPRRRELLANRATVQSQLDSGQLPGFAAATAAVRDGAWQVAPAPADLVDRRTEITGPVEARMMINALNSGARVFMADLEDAHSPTWANTIAGQVNLADAVRHRLSLTTSEGRHYRLNDTIATLLVRPRGWHLEEKHILVDGQPASASLVDFGLYFFHNAAETLARGSGPYFYLPKIEHYLEARLWNEVFVNAQQTLGVPAGSIRATVLIETVLAAFCMDEILYELRAHAAGLNAGRWDYIFSIIKKFRNQRDLILPDRAQITMTVPFMRAYTELLVRTCHRRGAHAIGGMSAFIPSRRDPSVNSIAIPAVRADKEREARDGFDGSWVAHPDLVPVCNTVFDAALGDRPNQKERLREDVSVTAAELLDFRVPGGKITEAGLRINISAALQYLAGWLGGLGAVAVSNLMEDAATAEISRAQLWQWIHSGAVTDDGQPVTAAFYTALVDEEFAKLANADPHRLQQARQILDELVLRTDYEDFLTLPAYALLGAA